METGGFDTHAGQVGSYGNLMGTLGDGLAAFYGDMRNQGLASDTTVVVFSEFGRRISENGSAGTDHGAAGLMMVLGGSVRGGLHGTAASLAPGSPTLENNSGDVRYETDFRSVYAKLLDQWLGVNKYKSIDGRATFRPFARDSAAGNVTVSGFYQYGWYARDRPRNVAIVMGSYEQPRVALTAQYLSATDNPFVAVDVQRRGLSVFGEGRMGPTGWAGVGGVDFFNPDASNDSDSRRRYIFGGAHWSQRGRGRLGVVVTLEQAYRAVDSQLLERRLLAQTHVEF